MSSEWDPLTDKRDSINGVVVDEFVSSRQKRVIINYRSYNPEGDLIFNVKFPRDVTPNEIAQYFLDRAEDLISNSSAITNPAEVVEDVEELRAEARRVPGLI